ncbi:translocation/assembly module TamB domain-containing protein [Roseitranquillus sediminis]|uniref:translocation/assembly module TamB domain-containing protein n=1 Tax=Roseitranquillus sediminis TaxID=2809051 RepID=UPI001D0C64AC|nr:translocation/assembly module TamB domain-containing protein [Roseitranquillus sediminis]MBM9596205.1 translocation/assembly module TamB domain-containing protein [Roseitranquillus sediminis]
MIRLLAFLTLLLPTAALAQEEERGFFGRLLGGGDGPGFLEGLIEDSLSGAGRVVQVRGFEGALSSRATIEELTIADDQGVWLTIRNAVLDWNRSALLGGRIEIDELAASEILLPRLPRSDAPAVEVPSPEAQGFSLPELPVSIRIDALDVERMLLGEPLLGVQAEVSVEGAVQLADGAGEADVAIERIDEEEGALTLEAAYDNSTEVVAIDLDLVEGPDGIVANLIDLPDRPSLRLTVTGDAPLSDFAAEIALETAGEERLAGEVTFSQQPVEGGTARQFSADIGGDIAPVFLPQYQDFFGPDIRLDVAGEIGPDGRTVLSELQLQAQALSLAGEVVIGADRLPELVDLQGRIAGDGPVLLPLAGPETRVGGVTLDIAFNASEGQDWRADIIIDDLAREGFAADRVALEGSGRIATEAGPEGTAQRVVTAAFDFAADALDFGDPAAAEALGERVTGRAEIAWTEGEPVEVELLRLEGESYGLTAEGSVQPDGLTVAGEATASAQDLSVFSGLAGRPLGGSAEMTLAGEGAVLEGAFDLALDAVAQDLSIGDPRIDPLLDGETVLSLRTERTATGTEIEEFRIQTPEVTAQADGTLATGASELALTASIADTSVVVDSLSGPAELRLTAQEDAAGWTFDLAADGAGAELLADGRVEDLAETPVVIAELSASIDDLAPFSELAGRNLGGSADVTAEGRASFDLRVADARMEATARDLRLGLQQVDPLLAGQVELALDAARTGDGATIRQFRIEAPEFQASVQGEVVDLDGTPVFDGTVDLAAADIAPFSRLAGRDLAGGVTASLAGQAAADLATFDLTVEAVATDLDPGLPGVAELIPGATTVTLDAARGPEGVTIDLARVSGERIFAELAGELTDLDAVPSFDGRAEVRVNDLAPLSELAGRELAGAFEAEAEGRLAFDGSSFDLTLDAVATDLDPGLPGAAAALEGRTELAATARREGDTVSVEAIRLANPQVTASGAGTVSGLMEAPAFDGAAEVALPNLAAFSGLAGRSLSGAANVSLDGAAALNLSVLDLALEAEGTDVDLGLPGGESLLAGQSSLVVTAVREGETVTLSRATLESGNLTAEAAGTLTDLETTPVFEGRASISADSIAAFGAFANRSLGGAVEATAEGLVAADLSRFDVTLEAQAQSLRVGQADVDRLLAGTTTLQVEAERADGVTVIDIARLDAPGLDAEASGRLGEAGADLDVSLRLADIGPYAPGFSGPATVDGTVAQTNGTLTVDLAAGGPGDISATVAGTIDTAGPTVDLSIEGSAPLAAANRFVQPRTLAGTVSFDLALQGTPGLEALSGTISSSDARIVAPTFGIVLEGIDLDARLAGSRIQIDATGQVQAGGSVAASGSVGLAGNLPTDLTVTLNDAVLRDPELYQTSVSGRIDVDGPLRGGGQISGELALGETEIRIPSTGLGGGGPIPEVTHVNEPADVRATRQRAGLLRRSMDGTETLQERQRNALALDLLIRAENRIFVRGRGLDAELGGSLRIGGTTANLIPSGQFELVRGRLDILGERLVLDEGAIRLQGDFLPNIRLVARTDTGEFVVLVVIEGPINEPEITFLSEPELPEDEVLARLLFGRGIEEISPLQAAQLASAVATLAGRGPGVIERLRQNFGLDDLDLTTTEDGAAGIRAGRYLSENIYTDLTVDSEGDTSINLNLDLTDSVTVKGGVDNAGGSSLGIFFERDY